MSKFSTTDNEIIKYTTKQLLEHCKTSSHEMEIILSNPKEQGSFRDIILFKANKVNDLIIKYYEKCGTLSINEIKRSLSKLVSNIYENLSGDIFEYLSNASIVNKTSNIENLYFNLTKSYPFYITDNLFLLAQVGVILQYNKQQLLSLAENQNLRPNMVIDEKITTIESLNEGIEKCNAINQKIQYFLLNKQKITTEIFDELFLNTIQHEEMLTSLCHKIKLNKNEIKMKILLEVKNHCSNLAEHIILNLSNMTNDNIQLFDIDSLHLLTNSLSEHEDEFIEKFIFTCYSAIFQDQLFKLKSCMTMSYSYMERQEEEVLSNYDTNQEKIKLNNPVTKTEQKSNEMQSTDQLDKKGVDNLSVILSEQEIIQQQLENAINEVGDEATNMSKSFLQRSANIDIPQSKISNTIEELTADLSFKQSTELETSYLNTYTKKNLSSSSDGSFCFFNEKDEILELKEYDIITKDFDLYHDELDNNDQDVERPPLQFNISPTEDMLETIGSQQLD